VSADVEAWRSHEVQSRDAAHGGDLGSEGFGKLNGVVAHSLRSPSIDA
jgi:hypothetical protein